MPSILHIAGCAGGPGYCRPDGLVLQSGSLLAASTGRRRGRNAVQVPGSATKQGIEMGLRPGTDRAGDKGSAQLSEPQARARPRLVGTIRSSLPPMSEQHFLAWVCTLLDGAIDGSDLSIQPSCVRRTPDRSRTGSRFRVRPHPRPGHVGRRG